MSLLDNLLENIPEGKVLDIRIGLHWTAVVAEVDGVRQCGLASTIWAGHDHHHEPDVPHAGQLSNFSGKELAMFSLKNQPIQMSLGVAALNALLPRHPHTWFEGNAEEVIARYGEGNRVALIGSFPFVDKLRSRVKELVILEQDPGPEELPSDSAPEILPRMDVVAITGMTLLNQTLESLLRLCSPKAVVILLGPSAPLSPLLFDHGVDIISGSVVINIDPVLQVVSQGGNFHQVRRAGVKLVNMYRNSTR